jgi:uncharacterized protein (TIGR02147 family)
MSISIFDYESYQDYLNDYLAHLPKRGHGFRIKIAEAMRCEASYVSRVLNGHAEIQLEQAEALSLLFNHTPEEFDFFLKLVQFARAGTPSLRKHFKAQMASIVEKRMQIRNRIQPELPLSPEQQARYFSHWQYAAVHMLCLIPEFQTREKLFQRLKISPARLNSVLDFLTETGLLENHGDSFKVGRATIHVPGDSPFISRNHAIWRNRAIQAIEDAPDQGLHYFSLMTMSVADARKIQEMYIQAVQKMNHIVDASGNETAVAFTLDFFEI